MAEELKPVQATDNQLSTGDLRVVLQLIDVAMTRGAYRAEEALNIGIIVDKLVKFLGTFEQDEPVTEQDEDKSEVSETDQKD